MANVTDAANAYANTLNQVKKAAGLDTGDGNAFADMLKQSVGGAIEAQHKSEKISGQALAGKADMTDVLQAVNDAELALNTVLAIRDKAVQAWEQLMRTPM